MLVKKLAKAAGDVFGTNWAKSHPKAAMTEWLTDGTLAALTEAKELYPDDRGAQLVFLNSAEIAFLYQQLKG